MRNGWIRLLLAGCVAAGLCGCRPKVPMGTVSGKVTLQGQPLAAGAVQFLNPKLGAGACVNLDASGSYKITDPIPTGDYLVAVGPFAPPPHEADKQPPATAVAIPIQYYAPTTSGLTATIKEGANVADFQLIVDR